MHYQQKKRCYLIKTGLLLLTALCAKVHASQTQHGQRTVQQKYTSTLSFATILHTIDTSTCYAWLTNMNKHNARRMQNALMAQLWKIVWLGIVGVAKQKKIFFVYALLSKLIIDILAQWVRNTKIATIVSHWPIGWALVHVYVVRNPKSTFSWAKYYMNFSFTLGIYYVAQKCYQPLSKKIIGHEYQRSNGSYLFDVCLGLLCIVVPSVFSESLVGLFCIVLPFAVLVLEHFEV